MTIVGPRLPLPGGASEEPPLPLPLFGGHRHAINSSPLKCISQNYKRHLSKLQNANCVCQWIRQCSLNFQASQTCADKYLRQYFNTDKSPTLNRGGEDIDYCYPRAVAYNEKAPIARASRKSKHTNFHGNTPASCDIL